jgi:signal transduction histidine kinase
MLELIQIASTGLETEEFATSFASCLKELMPFDKATINLLNPNDRSYQVIPVFPPITSKEGNNNTLSLELSAVEWVISRNRTNIEDDIIEGGEFASDSSLAKQGYRAAIRVPLSFNGQPFGCFSLLSYQQEVYGRKEQQRIEQLCAVLSHVIWYQHIAAVEKEALLEVEARDKARAQFVQVLGHELRTPLTPILACARMLKERLPTEAEGLENKLISNIMTGAQTLETRLSDLLDLAQYQTCAYTLELHKVDPRALIEKVISHFEPLVESKGQSLAVDLPDNLPPISADGRRLSQVLMNLLSNSVKFTPEGSNIQVRARLVKHEIVVEVQDDGPGLSEEQKQRLFEPYWRSEMDRHRFQGMGLGLALCKQLVEAHGGRIWAESEPGKGSTFAFAVPLERYAAKGGVHT